MRNHKPDHEVEYFDPPRRQPTKRELRRARRAQRVRKAGQAPVVVRYGAGVVMLAVVVGVFYGCTSAAQQGAEYDACIQKIAQTEGHDAAEIAMREGECR
ncbi:hypothetical protein SEA_MILANI_42 [Microbacterium phage Milani]|nr:hypothetical protein SEA_MILANI_42 [Microbacterium phage Milani]